MPGKPLLTKEIGDYGNRKTYASNYVKGDLTSAVFLDDKNPHVDHLFTAMQALAAEVWTNRRRMYIIEAMLEKKITITQESIQTYLPTAEEDARWKADRDQMVKTQYAPFLRPGNVNYSSAVAQGMDSHVGVVENPES